MFDALMASAVPNYSQGKHMIRGLGVDLIDSRDYSKAGESGFINQGNTCYANVSLCALAHTELLQQQLVDNTDYKRYLAANVAQPNISMVAQFVQMMELYWSEDCNVSCEDFMALVGEKYFSMTGMQEDATEFSNFLLNTLHEGFGYKVKSTCKWVPKTDDDRVLQESREAIAEIGKSRHSMIADLFLSQDVIRRQCLQCSYVTTNFDTQFQRRLTIPVPDDVKNDSGKMVAAPISLEDCLKYANGIGQLTKGNEIECGHCGKQSLMKSCTMPWILPKVLVIPLRRIVYVKTDDGYKHDKDGRQVTYPMLLDMAPFVANNLNQNTQYQLYAISCHYGNVSGGHYVAYAHNRTGEWFCYNDNQTTKVDSDSEYLNNKNAYILYYHRTDLEWAGSAGQEIAQLAEEAPACSGAGAAVTTSTDDIEIDVDDI